MESAAGTFEVKTVPQPPEPGGGAEEIGRLFLDKRFQGGLEAVSAGTMLGVRTAVQGSAGYVAIEKVTGSLQGRKGSFMMQHYGLMTRGSPEQIVTIIPDSGTEELAGVGGSMTIRIENGVHHYRLDYTLP